MDLPDGPGALLATPDGALVGATDEARAWLAAAGTPVPDLIARLHRAGARPGAPAHVLLSLAGRLELAAFGSVVDDRMAVVLGRASPAVQLPSLAAEHNLTARQAEVLELLLAGCTDREIAEALVIAPATAREHSGRVLRKLGVSRRAELAARLFPHLLGVKTLHPRGVGGEPGGRQ